MIDIENDVFDYVAKKIRSSHNGVTVKGEYQQFPDSIPLVTIEQSDNRPYSQMRTVKIEHDEDAVIVMFETFVYTNKSNWKKKQAKEIADTADMAYRELGFTRTMMQPVRNYLDSAIYRIAMRHEALIVPNADGKYYIHTL